MTDVAGSAMRAEMADQPDVLSRLIDSVQPIVAELIRLDMPTRAGIAFLARGSSDNAARVAAYCAQVYAGTPVHLVSPSVYTAFGQQPGRFSGWAVVAMSQSGRTPEIVDLAGRFARAGSLVVGVTNDADSPLAQASAVHIDLQAGAETAVPATKTVTAQILAGIAVAGALGGARVDASALAELPGQLTEVLADESGVDAVCERIVRAGRIVMTGRAYLAAAAFESALKLQETTGILAHAFSTADFRHGPIRLAAEDLPVLAFAGTSVADRDTLDLVEELDGRGARPLLVGDDVRAGVSIPRTAPELQALLATVRGQQVALRTALQLGLDPDRPAGLSKVTLTD